MYYHLWIAMKLESTLNKFNHVLRQITESFDVYMDIKDSVFCLKTWVNLSRL